MGRRKQREVIVQLPADKYRELVVFTAMLMGAEFTKRDTVGDWWYGPDYTTGYSQFDCARKWLWGRGLCVRGDGSMYENKNLTSEERHHVP